MPDVLWEVVDVYYSIKEKQALMKALNLATGKERMFKLSPHSANFRNVVGFENPVFKGEFPQGALTFPNTIWEADDIIER